MGNTSPKQINNKLYYLIAHNCDVLYLNQYIEKHNQNPQFDLDVVDYYDGKNNTTLIDAVCGLEKIDLVIIKLLHKNGSFIRHNTFYNILKKLIYWYTRPLIDNQMLSDNEYHFMIQKYEDIIKYMYVNISSPIAMLNAVSKIDSSTCIICEKNILQLFTNFVTMYNGSAPVPIELLHNIRYLLWCFMLRDYKNLINPMSKMINTCDNYFGNHKMHNKIRSTNIRTPAPDHLMHILCAEIYYNDLTIKLIPLFVNNGLTFKSTNDDCVLNTLYDNDILWDNLYKSSYNDILELYDCIMKNNYCYHKIVQRIINNSPRYMLNKFQQFNEEINMDFIMNHVINTFVDKNNLAYNILLLITDYLFDPYELTLKIVQMKDIDDATICHVVSEIMNKYNCWSIDQQYMIFKCAIFNDKEQMVFYFNNNDELLNETGKQLLLFDIFGKNIFNNKYIDLLLPYMDIDSVNNRRMTLLTLICYEYVDDNNYYDIIELLLSNNIDTNIADHLRNTAILYYVQKIDDHLNDEKNVKPYIDIFKLFLYKKTNVNIINLFDKNILNYIWATNKHAPIKKQMTELLSKHYIDDKIVASALSQNNSRILNQCFVMAKSNNLANNPVNNDVTIKNEPTYCVCCMENPDDYAYVNCGHKCVCKMCSQKINKCPICRQQSNVIKIILCN